MFVEKPKEVEQIDITLDTQTDMYYISSVQANFGMADGGKYGRIAKTHLSLSYKNAKALYDKLGEVLEGVKV